MTDTPNVEQSGAEAVSGAVVASSTNGIDASAGVDTADALTEDSIAKFVFRNPKDTKEEDKKPTLELKLPYVTDNGLIEALSDDKQREWIKNIINDRIYDAADILVRRTDSPVTTQAELDANLDTLTIEFLANVPVSQRKTTGISKEDWDMFKTEYPAVMIAAGIDKDKANNQMKMFHNRLQQIKTNKVILTKLRPMLELWNSKVPAEDVNAEAFGKIYTFLDTKFTEFLAITDETILSSLI